MAFLPKDFFFFFGGALGLGLTCLELEPVLSISLYFIHNFKLQKLAI